MHDPKRPHYYGGPDVIADPDEYSDAHGLNSRQRDVIKYVTRARKKGDPVEDYRKAIHWIEREISLVEREKQRPRDLHPFGWVEPIAEDNRIVPRFDHADKTGAT